jgi:glycosyltransferase involved in cell wall biosynthesis
MVEDTAGGLLFEPNDPVALAAALRRMICEPGLAGECGRRGQAAVRERYHAARMAGEMLALYEAVVGRP